MLRTYVATGFRDLGDVKHMLVSATVQISAMRCRLSNVATFITFCVSVALTTQETLAGTHIVAVGFKLADQNSCPEDGYVTENCSRFQSANGQFHEANEVSDAFMHGVRESLSCRSR